MSIGLKKISTLRFVTNDNQFDNWLRWVTLQPILRQQMGNSFLPYHDYGRGGRGWRDLWQDVNAALLMGNKDLADTLSGYFAGAGWMVPMQPSLGQRPGSSKRIGIISPGYGWIMVCGLCRR